MFAVNDQFWKYVHAHAADDPAALRFKWHGKECIDFDPNFAILQIECRRKFAKKFRQTLTACPNFLFPDMLACEQSTSDALAAYHASLIGDADKIYDLTAGLGIDAMHFASSHPNASVIAVDIEKSRTEALAYNAKSLDLNNLHTITSDCTNIITPHSPILTTHHSPLTKTYSVAFIDPARRRADGGRVYSLSDCQPDITKWPIWERNCQRVFDKLIVKASPMLDISHTSSLLPQLTEIIALGTSTECKELILVYDFSANLDRTFGEAQNFSSKPLISAVTIKSDGYISEFSFTQSQEAAASLQADSEKLKSLLVCDSEFSPKTPIYLYEPYPATMKAAPYNLLAQKFELLKLHPNTHLYVSDRIKDDFPGEIWPIERIYPFESKHIKRIKKSFPAMQVGARNFDMSADDLRRKLGVSPTGNRRLIAATALPSTKIMMMLGAMKNEK